MKEETRFGTVLKTRWHVPLLIMLMAACVDDGTPISSIPPDKKIVELDADEIAGVCAFYVRALGPGRKIQCSGGSIATGGRNQEDCEADLRYLASSSPTCAASVAEYQSCIGALGAQSDADMCSDTIPVECPTLLVAPCFEGTGR